MTAPPDGGPPIEIRREMTASIDELARGLRAAFPDSLHVAGGRFLASRGNAALQIDVEDGPLRRIALLALPTLIVTLRFTAGDAAARAALLAHMDRYLHRGGG